MRGHGRGARERGASQRARGRALSTPQQHPVALPGAQAAAGAQATETQPNQMVAEERLKQVAWSRSYKLTCS